MTSQSKSDQTSPISLLPNELLAEIFTLRVGQCIQPHLGDDAWPLDSHQETWPFSSRRPSWRIHSHLSCDAQCREWTQAMLVCRRWHDVILDMATLWACPQLERKSEVESYLTRAGSAPLFVRRALCDSDDWLLDFLGLQGGLSRCREIVLLKKHRSRVDIQPLMQHLPESAPLLEVLALTFKATLPESFLRGLPRLRSLVLGRCGLETWHSLPLQNLTTLIICKISDPALHPSLSDIVALLQQTPRLEMLALRCLQSIPDDEAPKQPNVVVPLRGLSRLSLTGSHLQALNVFQRLSVPSHAILDLNMYSVTSYNDISSRLTPLFQAHYNAGIHSNYPLPSTGGLKCLAAATGFRSLSVACTMLSVNVAASLALSLRLPFCDSESPECDDDHPTEDTSEDPMLSMEILRRGYLSTGLVLGVLRAIPLETITFLNLYDLDLHADQWKDLWPTVPALRILRVEGGVHLTMRSLILSLTPTVPPDATLTSSELEHEGHLLLPNLEELHIHHARDFRPSENEISQYTQLRECLRLRDAAGARLRLLEVEEGTSNFHMNTEQNVEKMRRDRSVDKIVWVWPYKEEPVSV
ncbi:hypothetical protein CONPUDRAFT_167607 [Coniophora puteana RWD-64-598 SS2]|uniref:Uncharacterized protein n=1 Tax=Coniophora puteana (strain RWD-64-598) TaxID=741705 RepID=A0A5M3MJ47_CONPW|nr:uncharacterized protein CONPUDRAFT_167607 [Coniophora puteana RWD-64-598 SS2]EIW78641.1 hypothetical protein CONPUDRAFT_167607 [Coniophora puteana RWD-64-598 SS2]